MRDLEDTRHCDPVLRRCHAHILRRESTKHRLAGTANNRRDNHDHNNRNKSQEEPTQMVKGANTNETNF